MASTTKKAFTLTELLIVIGLLVLLLTLALPAVSFITGSRSVESATNVVGALLGSARAQAIASQQPVGVMFFWDRTKEQTSAAICTIAQSWQNSTSYIAGDVVEYSGAYYISSAPTVGSQPSAGGPWTIATGYNPTTTILFPVFSDDFDIQTLPKGVGAQGLMNVVVTTAASRTTDSYISTAFVVFDSEGRLSTSTHYGLFLGTGLTTANPVYSRLGAVLQMIDSSNNIMINPKVADLGSTQTALLLYDHQSFRDAGFDERDRVTQELAQYTGGTPDEKQEEAWLDTNSTFLLINRYNGTLLKSE